ncbi:MAG: PRC-barrel domain-containing protein [Actinomycetota bacterium]|nr:PRC-barrel domain-containing protein [Actinomycetota bacterium]
MSETSEFTIGSEVVCSDGVCGDLSRVVLDPVARTLTHLVVEPRHGRAIGHLVPIDLVDSAANEIELRCTLVEFDALEDAEEIELLPGMGMGMGGMGGIDGTGAGGMGAGPQAITTDRVPEGEVEVRRGEHVHATDGAIGRVQGLLTDPGDDRVTHVLLDEGHLWGQKRVAIPIGAVRSVEDGVRLSLTKDEVRDLPAADLDHDE